MIDLLLFLQELPSIRFYAVLIASVFVSIAVVSIVMFTFIYK
jgi:hypothetical protein